MRLACVAVLLAPFTACVLSVAAESEGESRTPARETTLPDYYSIGRAVVSDDVEDVGRILRIRPELLWARDWDDGSTLLQLAISESAFRVAHQLLERGLDVNDPANKGWNRKGRTPLHDACEQGNKAAVQFLLERGADLRRETPAGATPLQIAVLHGHMDLARWLIEKGAKSDVFSASGLGNLDELKQRSSGDAKIAASRGENGATPLHFAAIGGRLEVASWLLERGASVNADQQASPVHLHVYTPLQNAIRFDRDEMVELLIKWKANVNAQGEGLPPLSLAAKCGNSAIIEVLLKARADVNGTGEYKRTALHLAAHHGRSDVVRVLLDAGANINALAAAPWIERFQTPLDFAKIGQIENARPKARNNLGQPRRTTDDKQRQERAQVCSQIAELLIGKGGKSGGELKSEWPYHWPGK